MNYFTTEYSTRIGRVIETAFTRLVGIEHPVVCAVAAGGFGDGGLVDEVLPAGEIVRRVVAEAEQILRSLP